MSCTKSLSTKSRQLSPPPLNLSAPLCAFDDIATHRTVTPSNLVRSQNFRTYESKFHDGFSNRVNRDLAAELAVVERLAKETSNRIQHTLAVAKKIDPTKNGVGSAGGHIARKLHARGPLNGNNKLKPKYPFTPQQLYATMKKELLATKKVVIENPDWEPNFVVHKTLEPPRVIKHPSRRRDTSKMAIEFEVADIMVSRGTTPLPDARPVTRKSRKTLNPSTLREIGVDAYRVKITDDSSKDELGSSKGNNRNGARSAVAGVESSLDSETLQQTDIVRPYTTGSYNPAQFISSNMSLSLELNSLNNESDIRRQFQDFQESQGSSALNTYIGVDMGSALGSSESSRRGVKYSSTDVFLQRIDNGVDRLMGWLRDQGNGIQEVDCVILSKKLLSQQRQLFCLPSMCYICVLTGLPPTIESAVQLFGHHSSSVIQFLKTVDPFVIPMRNIRKAAILKEKVLDPATNNEDAIGQKFAPEAKLRAWIRLFHVLAEALLVVYDIRKDRFGSSLASVLAPTSAKEEVDDSVPNVDPSDDIGYSRLVRRKFCADLINDQTCFDFWKVVFADGDSEIGMEFTDFATSETNEDVKINEQDILFIDVPTNEYYDVTFDSDIGNETPTPGKPLTGAGDLNKDLKLGVERAHHAVAKTHDPAVGRKSIARATSMPSLSAVVVKAVGTAIASVQMADTILQQRQEENHSNHHHHYQAHSHSNRHQSHTHDSRPVHVRSVHENPSTHRHQHGLS